jgi:hypothetical protein
MASGSDPAVRAGALDGVVPVRRAEFGGGGGQVVADGARGGDGVGSVGPVCVGDFERLVDVHPVAAIRAHPVHLRRVQAVHV